jgi:hypothetical protein
MGRVAHSHVGTRPPPADPVPGCLSAVSASRPSVSWSQSEPARLRTSATAAAKPTASCASTLREQKQPAERLLVPGRAELSMLGEVLSGARRASTISSSDSFERARSSWEASGRAVKRPY